jgi:hypothetical protein
MTTSISTSLFTNTVRKTLHKPGARVLSFMLPVPEELICQIKRIVLTLPVTTVILTDTSRTTAGISILKHDIKTKEVLLSAGKVLPNWLYLVTICVVVREIYCNACRWFRGVTCLRIHGVLFVLFACLSFCGAHISVVSQGAIVTLCRPVGSWDLPGCGLTGCYSYILSLCGFAGLTWLCFRWVLTIIFYLLVGSQGLSDCGFTGHIGSTILVVEFPL